ncbi:hypothetical protein H3C61_01340 [Candidatus Gracilibacteria bacterium]|nr:hypothetical protein [Candidatus Gracilibacteria bacterium]
MEETKTQNNLQSDDILKIKSLLESIEIGNYTSKDENLNRYIDNFISLKKDIEVLLETKNPVSFLFQINKIKSNFFIHLENLIDYVETSIGTFDDNTKKHQLLKNLGVSPISKDKLKYILDSKYFFEDIYFESYSKIDPDFKHLVQKINSLVKVNSKDIIIELLKEEKYKKYEKLLNFLKEKNIDFSQLKLLKERKFGNEIIKQLIDTKNISKSKNDIELFYSFFDLNLNNNLSYSKEVLIDNLINFDTINNFKKETLEQNKLDILDYILRNDKLDFDFYLKIYLEISKEEDTKKRGYLWGYVRNKIREKYFKVELFNQEISVKIDEKNWLENRVNYRVKLRNDESKKETYAFMDGFNQFRNIILYIEDDIFSDIYKGYILKIFSQKLALNKKTYDTFKYFMLFILPKNYLEYCKIFTFFKEYESFDKNQNTYKFYIIHFVLLIGLLLITFYSISWILGIGILFFIFGNHLKSKYFIQKQEKIRFHLGLSAIGCFAMAFYILLFLSNNGFFEVKIDYLTKVNNYEIVWQKAQENYYYNQAEKVVTAVYNSKFIKK